MIRSRALAAALPGFALVLSVTVLADAADKKVIRLWQTETEPQTLAVLNQTAAEYEKTHPDVSIKIEGLAWGDLEKKLTAALAAGAPPDHVRLVRGEGAPPAGRRPRGLDPPGQPRRRVP